MNLDQLKLLTEQPTEQQKRLLARVLVGKLRLIQSAFDSAKAEGSLSELARMADDLNSRPDTVIPDGVSRIGVKADDLIKLLDMESELDFFIQQARKYQIVIKNLQKRLIEEIQDEPIQQN